MNRRICSFALLFGCVSWLLAIAAPGAFAQYPSRPIRLIVPSTAGSNPDLVARLLAPRLAAALGQPVVVDNRPGAIGTIGLDLVAKATADGHTLGVQTLPFTLAPSLLTKVAYDTERDLAPVTLINWNYSVLAVPAASGIQSVSALLEFAKSRPGGLSYASQGNGTPAHLVLSLLARAADAKLVHVPYKGGPASVAAVLAGDVDFTVAGVHALAPLFSAGKLRPLASAASQRIQALPDLPTLIEFGYPEVSLTDWHGIVAPAATPTAIVERLHAELEKILLTPSTVDALRALGMERAALGPKDFAAYQRADIAKWRAIAREFGITAD
jgi:tripartite-type tricarboxylate transporter receptor subunit TctC